MNGVNKTLYIPLYGKSYVSKKGILLDDKKAEEIWEAEGFALKGKSKSKWLAYYMGVRSAVFDEWAKKQVADVRDAVVIHIGCGMDSRVLRVGTINQKWYDVDFAEVIEERKRYYSESVNYQMISGDVRDGNWLTSVPEKKCAIVVMEGVSMYLTSKEVHELTENLCGFPVSSGQHPDSLGGSTALCHPQVSASVSSPILGGDPVLMVSLSWSHSLSPCS